MFRRRNRRLGGAAVLALALLALGEGLVACGGQASPPSIVTAPPGPPATAVPGTSVPQPTLDPAAVATIRALFEATNARDLEKAATYFAPGARVGPDPNALVTANSVDDVITALRKTDGCITTLGAMRQEGATLWVEAEIRGEECPFLEAGETTHAILIGAQVVDGLITCTCPAATGSVVNPERSMG